jgi:hypothetical protein
MAFLIQSLTAPPEAGSTPEENASHRLQKYFRKKRSKPSLCHTTSKYNPKVNCGQAVLRRSTLPIFQESPRLREQA